MEAKTGGQWSGIGTDSGPCRGSTGIITTKELGRGGMRMGSLSVREIMQMESFMGTSPNHGPAGKR